MSMYVFLTRRELKMAVLLAKFHFFFGGGGGGLEVWAEAKLWSTRSILSHFEDSPVENLL